MATVICTECGHKRTHKARGLCRSCYSRRGVKERHSVDPSYHDDPTMEELDAMIREAMRDPPDWFFKEWEKPDKDREPLTRETLRAKRPSKRAKQGRVGL